MAWEENPRICLHMQLIAILSRIGVSLHYYVFIFHFSFSAFRPFAVIKTTPPKNEPRSDAEEVFRSSSAPRKWLEKFFQRAKSDLCGKQKASMLSLF